MKRRTPGPRPRRFSRPRQREPRLRVMPPLLGRPVRSSLSCRSLLLSQLAPRAAACLGLVCGASGPAEPVPVWGVVDGRCARHGAPPALAAQDAAAVCGRGGYSGRRGMSQKLSERGGSRYGERRQARAAGAGVVDGLCKARLRDEDEDGMLGPGCYSLLWATRVNTYAHTCTIDKLPTPPEVTVAAQINTVVKDWIPGRLGLSGGRNSW